MTDPMGANANATMTKSANKYQSHGKRLRRGRGGGFIKLAQL
jgi:hypothetical protein